MCLTQDRTARAHRLRKRKPRASKSEESKRKPRVDGSEKSAEDSDKAAAAPPKSQDSGKRHKKKGTLHNDAKMATAYKLNALKRTLEISLHPRGGAWPSVRVFAMESERTN